MKNEMEVETISMEVLDRQAEKRVRERKAAIVESGGSVQMALFAPNEHRADCENPAMPCD